MARRYQRWADGDSRRHSDKKCGELLASHAPAAEAAPDEHAVLVDGRWVWPIGWDEDRAPLLDLPSTREDIKGRMLTAEREHRAAMRKGRQ
jgi:hypothetical protein